MKMQNFVMLVKKKLKMNTSNIKIPVTFHNRPNYDYHFIVKKLAEEFENSQKYTTVPTEKNVTRIDKIGEEITKNISCILQFIDSTRFMASSLSDLVINCSEGIHKINSKYGHDDKNTKHVELILRLFS